MTLTDILDREKPEPEENSHTVPYPMMALIVMMTAFGVYYYAQWGATSPFGTPPPPPAEVAEQTPPPALDGEKIYKARCAACHQVTGQGLPGAFPPLAGSEWVIAPAELPASILVYGVSGEITVGGKPFKGQMPTFKNLKDEEIAAILTYVRSSWGNEAGEVSPQVVASVRELGREKPWAGEEELRGHFKDEAP